MYYVFTLYTRNCQEETMLVVCVIVVSTRYSAMTYIERPRAARTYI